MLSFDVRMILDIREDMESSPNAGFRKVFSNRVDPASLGTTDHPGETVGNRQLVHILDGHKHKKFFALNSPHQEAGAISERKALGKRGLRNKR